MRSIFLCKKSTDSMRAPGELFEGKSHQEGMLRSGRYPWFHFEVLVGYQIAHGRYWTMAKRHRTSSLVRSSRARWIAREHLVCVATAGRERQIGSERCPPLKSCAGAHWKAHNQVRSDAEVATSGGCETAHQLDNQLQKKAT